MKAKLLLIYLILLISFISSANSIRFNHLTSDDGISQSEVYAFLEASNGFMWFGTVDGLNRYDGYNIKTFNTDRYNPNSLSNNTIKCLLEDEMGRIWIGTDDGLNYYDPNTENIYRVKIDNNNKISVMSLFLHNDQLLVGSSNGLWTTTLPDNHIQVDEMKFKIIDSPFKERKIRTMIKSSFGGVWVLSVTNIIRLDFKLGKTDPVIVEKINFDGIGDFTDCVEDSTGCLWITLRANGIARYNPITKKLKVLSNDKTYAKYSKECVKIVLGKDGKFWIGTFDEGLILIQFNYSQEIIEHIESVKYSPRNYSGLNTNLIYTLYVTKNDKIWVGTIGSGINIYNPEQKKFQHYIIQGLRDEFGNSNFIRSVSVDNQNRILAGTHKDGLYLVDRKTNESKKIGFGKETVFHIQKYEENKYFICTSNGISLVELVGDNLKIYKKEGKYDKTSSFYVVKGNANIYWRATLDGLVRMRVIQNEIVDDFKYTKNSNPAISINNCRILFFDNEANQLFVGTEGGGLNCLKLDKNGYPQKTEVFMKGDDPNSISNNYVRSIIQDRDKNIWIGTYEGLNKLIETSDGTKKFISYTKKNGLPNNMIESIVEDNNHFLWIGTNSGLSKFSLSDYRFVNYNKKDGLQSNEFSEHTAYKTSNGEIVMGGINGINTFYPEEIKVSKLKPRVTITDFYLNNYNVKVGEKIGKTMPLVRSITMTDSIILASDNKNIGFTFSAMLYPNAEKVEYAYMLEGFDKNWHYTDAKNRNANYTNLRFGKYIFKVKATNTDRVWENNTIKEVFIHIKTPFFLTWYAFVLYVAAFIIIITYFSHFTIIRYKTKKKLLLEKEHNEKLQKLDELRINFFINISHDLRTPLTLIMGPLEQIMKDNNVVGNIRESLSLVMRNVKRLNFLVEQLLDIRKAESGSLKAKLQPIDLLEFTREEVSHFSYFIMKKGLNLVLEHTESTLIFCFDPSMISKVYFNIISNAIKFTNEGQIRITIKTTVRENYKILNNGQHDSYVCVEIKDTGIGVSKEHRNHIFERFYQDTKQKGSGFGIGLSHTKELIEAHNGFIEVESAENEGTTIRFFLPYIKNAEPEKTTMISAEQTYILDDETDDEHEEPINLNFKTILVVDDNPDMICYLRSGLKSGYNVISAKDGVEGLTLALKNDPDFIISDVMMPNMDGIEFCKEVRNNIKISHVPFVLLTAKIDVDTKYQGIEIGADDYIPKPFNMDYLHLRINNLLQSRERLRKLFQKDELNEPSALTVSLIDEQFMKVLTDAINENLSNPNFTINSLESQLGMSHSAFYRKIKNITGQSGKELLQNVRMKKARQLILENKGIRIFEVAQMVGFADAIYFSRSFKEMYGYAPSEIKTKSFKNDLNR